MPGLICHDCHIFRNKFASSVTQEVVERGIKKVKLVGYRCIKCTRKAYVSHIKPEFNRGWRKNFYDLVMALRKQQEDKDSSIFKQPADNVLSISPQIPEKKEKEGFGSKVARFFKGKEKQ